MSNTLGVHLMFWACAFVLGIVVRLACSVSRVFWVVAPVIAWVTYLWATEVWNFS